MATAAELIQVGIPVQAAVLLGDTIGAVALKGSSQQTAAALDPTLSIVTASAGNTGGRLSAKHSLGRQQKVVNISATDGMIYPANGGSINGLPANTGITLSANTAAFFECISFTAGISNYLAIV